MAIKRIRLTEQSPSRDPGSMPLTVWLPIEQPFLPTREHARLVEFAEACSHYRYISVCYGCPGVGKTRSAQKFANFLNFRGYGLCDAIGPALGGKIARCKTIIYMARVSNTPQDD